MFLVPLSVRNNLNFLVRFDPKRSKMVVIGDELSILLWNEEYIELVTVPLLGRREETSVSKALPVIDAAISERDDGLHVFAITATKLYHFTDGLSSFSEMAHNFSRPEISAWGQTVVIFSSNSFYLLTESGFKNLRISPYFRTIVTYSCGRTSNTDIIVYQTDSYTSIYSTDGIPILKKYPCTQKAFISDKGVAIQKNNEIFLYDVSDGVELLARINPNVRISAKWKYLKYQNNLLYMSGITNSGYILYVDGYLFDTNDLVQSFGSYRGCFIGVSSSFLYFLPNDKDFDLKLLDSEYRLLNNVLNGNFTPYTCRSFKFSKTKENSWDLAEEEGKERKIGYFLGFLVYCGFKVECCKLICNTLNEVEKDSKAIKKLKVLNEAMKFGHRVYKRFVGMNVDIEKIYGKITEIIHPQAINEELLVDMAEISFRNIDFIEVPRYFLLQGRKLMEQGEEFMEPFYKCTGLFDDVVRILEKNDKIAEIILLWKKTGFGRDSSLECICKHNLAYLISQKHAYSIVSGWDVLRCLCEMWKKSKDRCKASRDIVQFIGGRYDLLVGCILPESMKTLMSSDMVEYFLKYSPGIEQGISFLLSNGRSTEASALYYHLLITTGDRTYLDESLRNIYDKVFIYRNKFVGRESLEELKKKEEMDYRQIILDNTEKIKKMSSGCLWTNVCTAEQYPEEYSQYLQLLKKKM
ncbi:uncharacterized protein Eint_061530 [Encephalitozoon intestinalis ATCC 50506]|uniref:Uncharacterized protein n=1 Tax=Encephalitozoon intestinalis (strain ATCC 50506) TaxID=876142 RepID=E0S7S9_ENCIT|nr:uncharacterized protein Eint_061530 [Encephalitozoon intestinalis ATCC 50506]ADM11758.1 hypothetical protein Eint_061530 [Encephalitozoon intestinalis ATCC 50506]UTX45499.1 acylamino-acid-releasing enzyme [Encephalitozoon intestinalis]